MQISLVNVAPRPFAGVRSTNDIRLWPRQFRQSLDQVYDAIRAGKVKKNGHNVMVYRMLRDHMFDIECGVETDGPFEPVGNVVYRETPAGMAVTAAHFGAYSELGRTHDAIVEWLRANGHTHGGASWEIYGDWHDGIAQVRTDIFHSIRS